MFAAIVFALRVAGATALLSLNTIVHVGPLLLVALAKLVVPGRRVRRGLDRMLMAIAGSWIGVNSWMIDHLTTTRIEVSGLPEPDPEGQMLVICNHQSWVDIPILQKLFNRRLPLLRFFLKRQLIWVPLLGLAWWALDFPFMKRHSREQIRRRPELARDDVLATRAACARFRDLPVAIVNFVEGTRFRPARHAAQSSPYRHLLKPRAGGVAFTFDAMGDALERIVDVTIVYPHGRPRLVDLFANRVREVRVAIQSYPVPDWLQSGDYLGDPEFRDRVRDWINTLWQEKDQLYRQLAR
ncbi:acyltransferase [Wenzhouxiangella sp. AB-CW3]|uniref:acyltransferase n=1 Tax=Wenzhouxiangella sp. AB-CW3 TaxID=2771012 RepID=UPI00168ADA5D|nr:acyltransferase [Wenzhouxiangella sp. AB-CW3]QOC21151.1 acyltransferase [Wenzhouxiangella sp. AB-CW3]